MLRATGTRREAKTQAMTKRSQTVIPISDRRIRFHRIVADAQTLGVSRVHLWQVLTGRRQSKTLLARYRALKRS